MSDVQLAQVKAFLDVTFDDDDEKIQLLIDAAEDEAKRFLGRPDLPQRDADCPCVCDCDSESTITPVLTGLAPLVRSGVFLLVQAMYDQPGASEMEQTRRIALQMMHPYRCQLGV